MEAVFSKSNLNQSSVQLKTYKGEPLKVISKKSVVVEYQSPRYDLSVVVVAGNGPSSFGRNWLKKSVLSSIKSVQGTGPVAGQT